MLDLPPSLENCPQSESELENRLGSSAKRVLKVLLGRNLVGTDFQLKLAQDAWVHRRGIQDSAIALGFISQGELLSVLADEWKLPIIDLSKLDIPTSVVGIVPERFARKHLVVSFGRGESLVELAITAPAPDVEDEIQLLTGHRARCSLAMPLDILRVIDSAYDDTPRAGSKRPEPIEC